MATTTPKPRNIYSRVSVKKINKSPSLTIKSQAESTKIQNIIKKYQTTGYVPEVNANIPKYLDTTNIGNLQEIQNQLINVNNYFLSLDPKIRLKFNNDPHQLVTFLQNPNNKDEAIKLDLIVKPEGYLSPEELAAKEAAETATEEPTT